MTSIQEQALRSGLAFLGCDNDDDVPQWSTTEWPPMLDGWRFGHASVVVDHDKDQQTVVVTGGYKPGERRETNSVLLLAVGANEKKWKEGPRLTFNRMNHTCVVCNGSVYIIGGETGGKSQTAIEKIDVMDLTRNTSRQQWTNAKYSLIDPEREGCAATVVNNRYIVVAGGKGYVYDSCKRSVLSSVEIIDTINESPYAVIYGPSMKIPRQSFGMEVIGPRVYVIGGFDERDVLDSVEYLEFSETPSDHSGSARSVFQASFQWKMQHKLALSFSRSKHSVTRLGHCLIVGGGEGIMGRSMPVEVLNTEGDTVWNLPVLSANRFYCSLVATANGIVLLGASGTPSCESLPLVSMKHFLKVCLLLEWCSRVI